MTPVPGYPAETTLASSVSSGATSITPTSVAGLSAPCYIVMQDEVIYCPTGPVAGAFTGVTRGALGSVPAAHTAFTPLFGLYSDLFPYSSAAEFMGAIAAELVTVETRLQTAIGGGTVTSVALTMPAEFTVAGSPITSAGTLAVSKAAQTANEVYAGPSSGAAGAPAFRALVPADLPLATTAQPGAVQPDGTTITIAAGVISAVETGGTVTSVALTMPAEFSVAGSPVTGAGTLAVSKAVQTANEVYAGPTTGAAAAPAFRALVPADLPVATTGQLGAVEPDGTTITIAAGVISAPGTGGTVTSVALTMPAEFSVAGSPITGAGTLAVSKATQAANEVYAGPTTGAAAAPGFRAVVSADLPIATTGQLGAVKPDGSTITISAGVISAAAGGLQKIEQTVLASPAASIAFSSIPASYSQLVLMFNARSSDAASADNILLQFNADTGTNYGWQYLLAQGSATPSAAQATAQTGALGAIVPAASVTGSTIFGGGSVTIPGYSSASLTKSLFSQNGQPQNATTTILWLMTAQWNNTAAINAITLILSSGSNFLAGSTFTLYGLP